MRRRRFLSGTAGLAAAALPALAGCTSAPGEGAPDTGTVQRGDLELEAAAFDDGGTIPARYTCDGGNVNPGLTIEDVSRSAESLALVVDDPDAPGDQPFVHWLLWNVPPQTETIPRSVARGKTVDSLGGAKQGTNSKGVVGYTGPCPPKDDGPHTYRFTLSALDTTLDVPGGAKRGKLASAMEGHVVARTRLTATYER